MNHCVNDKSNRQEFTIYNFNDLTTLLAFFLHNDYTSLRLAQNRFRKKSVVTTKKPKTDIQSNNSTKMFSFV